MQQNQSDRYSTYFRHFIVKGLLCLWALFIQHSFANPVQSNVTKTDCQSEIIGYQISKNTRKDQQNQPDSHWLPVAQLPDYWNTRWKNFEASAWYKIHLNYNCPHPTQQAMTLLIENINMAGTLYWNGEKLWESDSLQAPLSRHLHQPLKWVIPASSLKQGENILLIHVLGVPTQKSGLGKIYFGQNKPIAKIFDNIYLEKRFLPIFNLTVNLIIALFCLMVWCFNPKDFTFLWFAFTCLAWSLYSLMVMTTQPWPLFSNLFFDQLQLFIFCAYTFFGCVSVWHFAGKRFPRIEKLILTIYITSALIILSLAEPYQPQAQFALFVTAVIIFILKAASYPFVVYKTKHKEAYLVLVNQMIFLPIAINDAIYMMTHKGHILSPYTAPITSIFIGFILALRLAKKSKRIQEFNKTLEQSVIKAKEELTNSLNTQHQLAMENVKLQQRIQLSHDLHDGLGGSIVRSMALLDHNNVDQNQMKSILKILRSDLRQVIDSGSGLDTKIPENPILWIAPLRRRFINVFEDLDIESHWEIPQHWLIEPPPLYCLTLARVAEEALTNIIKHSHASHVNISFVQDWTHNLILTIQDNGVGFDNHQVQPHLHVGLHSMQMRLKRLGGLFEIESTPNNTVIRAMLNTQHILDSDNNKQADASVEE